MQQLLYIVEKETQNKFAIALVYPVYIGNADVRSDVRSHVRKPNRTSKKTCLQIFGGITAGIVSKLYASQNKIRPKFPVGRLRERFKTLSRISHLYLEFRP